MTTKDILEQLEKLGTQKMRDKNTKRGATGDQFGVKKGDIRTIAKPIKSNHELALGLWETGNLEAQLLAVLIIDPKKL